MKLVAIFEQSVERSLEIRESDLEEQGMEAKLALLHGRLARLGVVPQRSAPSMLRGVLRTFEAAFRAHYCPAALYHGSVKLILARDRFPGAFESMDHIVGGWRRWIPDLAVHEVPGNHMTLLKQPHVNAVADLLFDRRSD
ncbi:thioesterase domain-containing protein [Bradyrhizobium sp. USDA 4369]